MLILSNLLALVLISADGPAPTPTTPDIRPVPTTGSQEVWHLTLREAIRIGLDNTEVVRVLAPVVPGGLEPTPRRIALGDFEPAPKASPVLAPVVIGRLNADLPPLRFKAAVMAQVRSIEQTYWALGQVQVALWARETAVRLGDEILRRERDQLKLGKATTADVAEAEQQLANYRLQLVSATSDLITTERQLRAVLGLAPADNRRIVPDSAPKEAKVDPDWKESLDAMNANQPDILDQRLAMYGVPAGLRDVAPPTEVQAARQKATLEEILRKATHNLARGFLEIDANYKLYQTAMKLRASAQQRLEAQRASYEDGRASIDRLLDAVSQYASSIAQESQYLAYYNTSIAAFEEAKGTLLATDGITIAEFVPKTEKPATDTKLAPAAFEAPASPTTYRLRAKVGGKTVLEVEVEVQEAKKPAPGRDDF